MSQTCSHPQEGRLYSYPHTLLGNNSPIGCLLSFGKSSLIVTSCNGEVVGAQNSSLAIVIVSPHRIKGAAVMLFTFQKILGSSLALQRKR